MKTKCPYCNYIATEHETLDYIQYPKEDDISFCINCGEVSKYENKKLVKVNVESLDETNREKINRIRIAWLKTRAIKSAENKTNGK